MTVNNLERYLESMVDWIILRDCFGKTIEPSDIDGWVERRGLSLFLEHKLAGADTTDAQDMGHRSLAAQGNTVIVFWTGKAGRHDVTHIRIHRPEGTMGRRVATLADLRETARAWFEKVERRR